MSFRFRATLVAVVAFTAAVYGGSLALSLTRDAPSTFDTDAVRGRAATACTALRTGIDALPPLAADAGPAQRSARLGEQERLVARLVADVRALGSEVLAADEPAEQWLRDWEALVAARRAQLSAGGAFAVPQENGRPLTSRMSEVGVPACRVPTPLTVAP